MPHEHNYYDDFEATGVDLKVMRSALSQVAGLPGYSEALEPLRSIDNATLLILGSATAANLDNIALLERDFRPGKATQDHAVVIDRNAYPLTRHQQRMGFLEEWRAAEEQWLAVEQPEGRSADYVDPLPYPAFSLVRADMRQLPFRKGSMNIVISDYTLNFLQNPEDVTETFSEISHVMALGGILLLAVKGHPEYESLRDPEAPRYHVHSETMTDGTPIHLLPIPSYVRTAEEHGLDLKVDYLVGSSLLCSMFTKEVEIS